MILPTQKKRFLTVNQFTLSGTKQLRRPDLVAFVNGIPLAVIELKPANEQTDVWDAFNQLQTYKDELSDLFTSNMALAVSDGWNARGGHSPPMPSACCLGEQLPMKMTAPLANGIRNLSAWFFAREMFLDYLRYFVLFEQDGDVIVKKLPVIINSMPCVRLCRPP